MISSSHNPMERRPGSWKCSVTFAWLTLGFVWTLATVTWADEADAPKAPRLERMFDPETFLVVELDADAVRPRELAEWARSRNLISEPLPAPFVAMAEATRASLRAAGVERVLVVLTTRDLFHGGMLLIPSESEDEVHALVSMLASQIPERYGFRAQRMSGLVGVGTDRAWQQLERRLSSSEEVLDETTRRRLAPLFEKRVLPHRLTISLPPRHREELIGLWPDRLPPQPLHKELESAISPRQFVQDVESLSFSWRLPPEPELALEIHGIDSEAAERMADSVRRVLPHFLSEEEVAGIEAEIQETKVVVRLRSELMLGLMGRLSPGPWGQQQAANQLKQIGVAMHNYHDSYQHLPPRATVTPEGEGLLSWRVHLLPYVEQQAMYQQFRLDESWDSAHNRRWSEVVIPVFTLPGDRLPPGHTRIRFPVVEDSLWQGDGPPRKFSDVVDGMSNTIAAAIAPPDKAVPWTKPEPWELDPDDLIGSFFGDAEQVPVLMLDGSVRTLSRTMDASALRALLTHAGDEPVP